MHQELGPESVQLYKMAVANPTWSREDARAELSISSERLDELVTALRERMLFRRSLDPEREYDAVGPETAVVELLAEEEKQIRQRQNEMARVRAEMLSLLPTYFEARQSRRTAEAVDVIEDVDMVRHLLGDRARRVKHELCIAHPGSGMSEDGLARSLALDLMMLERGVVMRSVLQHSTRYHAATQRYVGEVLRHGAQVRTVPIVPRRLIAFDREVAFIPLETGDPAKGAVLVQEPGVVEHLLSSFDLMWHNGRPFPITEVGAKDAEVVDDAGKARDEMMRAILEQMSSGAKDEMIARRLGISVRTCRRHIAAIIADLGAYSRFQAGVLAQQRGLLD
ncbi:regulatory protein, luxR family [Goodfellowiella coeruleoviolacea]|uniref:Regulatory protein, luxR family n=1 Tax=Goodfellowiella coeruleoviolacea TaxID=334858 RepID=A0AAE3GEY1_9PSEU|nr:regulatory protein, luxR family [Goodfellowiella coeruleoviolacea]